MIRILGALIVVLLTGSAIVVSVPSRATGAQQDIAPLQTTVADLSTRVAALETAVAGGAAGPTGSTSTHAIKGEVLLINAGRGQTIEHLGRFGAGGPCGGKGGYDDLREGAPVVVLDESGSIIATSALQEGVYTENIDCLFRFVVEQVPDAEFYTIEVSHRGGLTFSRAELGALGWEVHFSIGP